MVVMVGLMLSCYLVGRLKFNIYNFLCCGAKGNISFITTGFKKCMLHSSGATLSPFIKVGNGKEALRDSPRI